MSKFIIVNGRKLVSETRVGKRSVRGCVRQVFTSCKWTNDPGDAQTYCEADAREIAQAFGGEVKPYSAIAAFYR